VFLGLMLLMPVSVDDWRNFRGLDLGLPHQEDAGVQEGDADLPEVCVNGRLKSEDGVLLNAVDHAHDFDAAKVRASLAPVAVSHNFVTANFSTSFLFYSFRNGPEEDRLFPSHAHPR